MTIFIQFVRAKLLNISVAKERSCQKSFTFGKARHKPKVSFPQSFESSFEQKKENLPFTNGKKTKMATLQGGQVAEAAQCDEHYCFLISGDTHTHTQCCQQEWVEVEEGGKLQKEGEIKL